MELHFQCAEDLLHSGVPSGVGGVDVLPRGVALPVVGETAVAIGQLQEDVTTFGESEEGSAVEGGDLGLDGGEAGDGEDVGTLV